MEILREQDTLEDYIEVVHLLIVVRLKEDIDS